MSAARFKKGDRVRMTASDNYVPKGTKGTVLENSDIPYIEWDGFAIGHSGPYRDGRKTCWVVPDDDLEGAEDAAPSPTTSASGVLAVMRRDADHANRYRCTATAGDGQQVFPLADVGRFAREADEARATVEAMAEALDTLDSLWAESEAQGVDFTDAIEHARAALARFYGRTAS